MSAISLTAVSPSQQPFNSFLFLLLRPKRQFSEGDAPPKELSYSEPRTSLTLAWGLVVTFGASRVPPSSLTRVSGLAQTHAASEPGSGTAASPRPLASPGERLPAPRACCC